MKVRTSVLRGFALLALSSLAFTACDDKAPTVVTPPEITITVTPQSAQLQVGQSTNFVAVVGGSTNQTVTWASSTPAVASVNAQTGAVTAIAPGTTTITATSAADASKRAAAQVVVVAAPPAPVVNVAVVPSAASMLVGQTLQLVPVVTNATNTAVTYQSLDGAVATVSASGVVTAVGPGTAVIRVSSVQDATKSANAVITVTAVTPPPPPAVTITLVPGAATVAVGGTVTFTAASSAPGDVITYTSSNNNVLTITAAGVATGVAAGNAVVTARSTVNPNAVGTAAVTVTTVAPPPAVTLSVTPTVASMVIGDSLNLAATSSAAGDVITFTSSNQNVVSVDSNGRLVAIAAGNAIITARSTVNPNTAVTVAVNVSQAPPETQPSISIQSVTTAFGVPVPSNNPAPGVGGALNVTVNVSAGSATQISSVEVRLNGILACDQLFSPPLAPTQGVAQIVCPINTAEINPDGTAKWLNGTYQVTARAMSIVDGSEAQVAQATYGTGPIRIFNADVAAVTIMTTGANAIGGPTSVLVGQRWDEGSLVATVQPAMYSGGTVASTRICLNANGSAIPTGNSVFVPVGTVCRQVTGPVNNTFTATFPKASGHSPAAAGVAGVEAQNFTASVTTLTVAGANGPIGTSNALNLDNMAPVVTSLIINPNQYVNGAFTFGSAGGCGAAPYTGTCFAMNDQGADSETVLFNVLTTSGAGVTGGSNISNPSGLEETATATGPAARILQAVATDAVGNTRTVFGSAAGAPSTTVGGAAHFGIDLLAPTATFFSGPASGSTNPVSNTYDIRFVDAGNAQGSGPSGFSATPLQLRVERFTPDNLGGVSVSCVHPLTGAVIVANCFGGAGFVTTGDDAGGAGADVTLPFAAQDAYFRVTARVRDFAGNLSAEIMRHTLDDQVAPVVGNIITPTSISGGAMTTFSAQMQDNVELGDQLGYVGYNAIGAFLVTSLDVLGSYGFDELSTPRNAVHTVNAFIRSVETTAGNAPSGVIAMATDMNLAVRDLAGSVTNTVCPAAGTQTFIAPAGPGSLSGSCRTVQASIVNAINLGMGGNVEASWSSANRPFGAVTGTNPNGGGTAFTHTSSAAPVCSNTPVGFNAGCNVVAATTKTLTATATGPAQTFANPFTRVDFYYTDAANRSIRIGTGSVTVTDNTITNIRTWTYTASWNAAGVIAGNLPVFALGVDAQGRSLMSNAVVVPVTSD